MTWYLKDKAGKTVLMKNGEPFTYTTEWTARRGAKYLNQKRKGARIRVVKAGVQHR